MDGRANACLKLYGSSRADDAEHDKERTARGERRSHDALGARRQTFSFLQASTAYQQINLLLNTCSRKGTNGSYKPSIFLTVAEAMSVMILTAMS